MVIGPAEVDEAAARALSAAGWRQCSIFRPPVGYPLEPRIAFDGDTEWLIVCSQSCTVCSRRFHTDPIIEVAVAKLSRKFNARSPEAKGGDGRKLMLPLPGGLEMAAIICDVNRRTFIKRRDFLQWRPEASMKLSSKSDRLFQGWLARSYIRIAMPDALVTRLTRKPDGLFARVRAALNVGGETPLHFSTPAIFVHWSTDDELADDKSYSFRLLFACDDEDTLRSLTEAIEDALRVFRDPAGHDGIVLTRLDLQITDDITLKVSNTYTRLSEWDDLSELGEVAEAHLAGMLQSGVEPE